jgi:uncharacterized protein YukE
MGTTGEYRAEPEAMRSTVGNVGGIIANGINAVSDLEKLVLQSSAFAGFGSVVAAANEALHSEQVSAVRSLLQLLQEINGLVKHSADAYQRADEAVSDGYGGGSGSSAPAPTSIWGAPHAAQLAETAITDSVGSHHGQPSSVGNVLRYLDVANLGRLSEQPLTDSRFNGVADFNDWLAGDADNQARVGLIEVYAGTARTFGDVPGGVQSGDVVVVEPLRHFHHSPVIGVAGDGGALYNHGLVDPNLGGLAKVSVYRPASV